MKLLEHFSFIMFQMCVFSDKDKAHEKNKIKMLRCIKSIWLSCSIIIKKSTSDFMLFDSSN